MGIASTLSPFDRRQRSAFLSTFLCALMRLQRSLSDWRVAAKLMPFSDGAFHTARTSTPFAPTLTLNAAQSFQSRKSRIWRRKTTSQDTRKAFLKRSASANVGNRVGTERRLAHLEGYRNSRPKSKHHHSSFSFGSPTLPPISIPLTSGCGGLLPMS